MKNNTLTFFISAVLLFAVNGPVAAGEQELVYQAFDNETGTKVIGETDVTIKTVSADESVISRRKKFENYLVEDEFTVDRNQSLKSWHRICREQDTDFTAVRDGNTLKISGTLNGAPVDKELELGVKALHIYPKYTLSVFALSGVPQFRFWTLRRDELDKLPMKAVNKGTETVIIGGKEVEAIRVYYTIADKLRERSFHHDYFFRKSDGLFIKKVEKGGRIEVLTKE